MRVWLVAVAMTLAGCGGGSGGTTGTNYSEPPPVAEIVATPTPAATPDPVETPEEAAPQPTPAAAGGAPADETMTIVDPGAAKAKTD